LTVLGAVFPHFFPEKCEISHGGADLAPRAKFYICRGNVSPREKPIFGPLSKNNTDMAALRAGLPVTRNQYASPPESNAIPVAPFSDSDEMFCCCGIPIGPLC